MFKLFRYFKPREWGYLFLALGFIVLQVWLDLKMPDYMGKITELVQMPGSAMSEILRAGGMMLLLTLASILASVVVVVIAARIAADFSARLRLQLFEKVQGFSMEEINKFSIASLITRTTNDVTQVQAFLVMGLQILIKSPILAVWTVFKIVNSGWQWSLAAGLSVVFLLLLCGVFFLFAFPKFRRIQTETDELNRMSRENLTGLRVVRAYNAEKFQEKKFEKANVRLAKTNLYVNRLWAVLMPSIDLLMNGLVLSIYWIGAVLIAKAGLADKAVLFADMMVFTMYATQLLMAFLMLMIVFLYLPRASVSAKRVAEVLSTESVLKNGTVEQGNSPVSGEIEFRNVSFRYPDAENNVLEDVSFTVKRGETAAFIGSTGSGKSTLINLIPRFFDVTGGEILVDGVDVRSYTQSALRDKIGFVPQKAKLFAGTVESNVSFGKTSRGKPGKEDVVSAVEVSQAKEFVDTLADGYASYVAPGGTNLSGGQKQRLSIARAVARKPDILIFDDSFSALDYKTDQKLRAALSENVKGTTVLIVAQRIGTIRHADKIVVMDEGKVAGIGNHTELMDSCEVYREIAYSQLSKEELE